MEDRKRQPMYDSIDGGGGYGGGAHEMKRLRAEDIVGDDRKVTTRLLLNRAEFSKVIGKGGQTIAHIRNTFGANIKGADVDEEHRIVIVTGHLKQVIDSFDLIAEVISWTLSSSL